MLTTGTFIRPEMMNEMKYQAYESQHNNGPVTGSSVFAAECLPNGNCQLEVNNGFIGI